jgi:hypothetical protein
MTIGDLKHILKKHETLPDDMVIRVCVSDHFTRGVCGEMARTSSYDKNSSMNFTHNINFSSNEFTLSCTLEKGYDDHGEKTKIPKITFRKST